MGSTVHIAWLRKHALPAPFKWAPLAYESNGGKVLPSFACFYFKIFFFFLLAKYEKQVKTRPAPIKDGFGGDFEFEWFDGDTGL